MSVDRKPSSFALDSVDLDGYLVSLVDRMAGTTTLPADQHSELLDALSDVALAADRPRVEFLLSTLEAVRSRGPGYEVAFNIFSSHFAVRNEDFVLAEALCEVAHRSALALGREVEVAACCLIRGNVQLRLGNYRFARIHYDEAVVAARRSGA